MILTLKCWVSSKAASSTIFWVFGMTLPGIEPQSPGPLANTLLIRPMAWSTNKSKSKVGDRSWGRPEGSLFNSYYTEMQGRVLLLSPDCSSLPLIRTLYCWVLSKVVSSTIFRVFGMTRPGIEPRSSVPLANTLPIRPMARSTNTLVKSINLSGREIWLLVIKICFISSCH